MTSSEADSPTVTRSLAQCQAFLRSRASASYSQKIANLAQASDAGCGPEPTRATNKACPFPVLFIGACRDTKRTSPPTSAFSQSLGLTEISWAAASLNFCRDVPEHQAMKPISRVARTQLRQDADVRVMAPSTGPEIDLPASPRASEPCRKIGDADLIIRPIEPTTSILL